MQPSLFLLVTLFSSIYALKFVEQFSKSALSVIHGSRLEKEKIRLCTCKEMNDCFESAKLQALDCFDPCFMEIQKFKLVSNPNSLKGCFYEKKAFVNDLLLCFQNNIKACAEDQKSEKEVPSANLKDLIDRVEHQVTQQLQTFLHSVHSAEIEKVGEAAKAVGSCVKECFIKKNSDGFCFDKINCMPFITDRNARRSIRQCSRAINWKHEVSDLCKCSAEAGIGSLANYCGMLNVMGK